MREWFVGVLVHTQHAKDFTELSIWTRMQNEEILVLSQYSFDISANLMRMVFTSQYQLNSIRHREYFSLKVCI